MNVEQIVFLLVFGAVGLVNMLMRKEAANKGTKRPIGGGTTPSQPARQADEDERLRKFMEALGVPASAAPPRQIARSQPRPVVSRPAARVQTPVRKQIPRQVVVAPVPAPVRVESSYQTENMGSTAVAKIDYEVPAPEAPVATGVAPTGPQVTVLPAVDFKSLLRSPSSIRTAMVLKEILGPCRGLQAMEIAPGLR